MSLLSVFLLISPLITPTLQGDAKQLKALAHDADLIVLAEVSDVGTPPNFWSGQFPATQQVNYKVVEVIKGHLDATQLDLGLSVVQNSSLSDTERPSLSPHLFAKGKLHIIFLKTTPSGEANRKKSVDRSKSHYSSYEVYSVLSANEDLINTIGRVIR